MTKTKKTIRGITLTLALFAGLSLSGTASATLVDLGSGLIYDDVLDVTWLQDANTTGDLFWATADAWAQNLVFGGASNWRLPSLSVAGGTPVGSIMPGDQVDCSTATEMQCRDNELGYMYYQNLGGTAGDDLTGDQGLIQNIQSNYWSGTLLDGDPDSAFAFSFGPPGGGSIISGIATQRTVWAVHPGIVPEPGTALLLGLGLAGLGARRSSRRRQGRKALA